MSQITPVNYYSLPKEIWYEAASYMPYTDLVHLLSVATSFSPLKDNSFWDWRNRIQHPFVEYDTTKTAFENFKYFQNVRNNMHSGNWETKTFPCLTTIDRENGGPMCVGYGQQYLVVQSNCGMLEWFDATTHMKLGEFQLRINFGHNGYARNITEHNGLLLISFHDYQETSLIIFCPQKKEILLRSDNLPNHHLRHPLVKIHNNAIYTLSNQNSLRKFKLDDLEFSQEIELYEVKDGENKCVPAFDIDKNRKILYALIQNNVANSPGNIGVYDLNFEAAGSEVKPLHEIPVEKVPVYHSCIVENGSLYFFRPEGIAEKWDIDFEEGSIRKIYSVEQEIFSFQHQSLKEDYIYSRSRLGEVTITDARTGNYITTLAGLKMFLGRPLFGKTPVLYIKPGKDSVALVCHEDIREVKDYSFHVINFNIPPKKDISSEVFKIYTDGVQKTVEFFEEVLPETLQSGVQHCDAFCETLKDGVEVIEIEASDFFNKASEETNEKCVIQ